MALARYGPNMKVMVNQVSSRQGVADFGEAFTSERKGKDMLDLVKQETERIDSRFLFSCE